MMGEHEIFFMKAADRVVIHRFVVRPAATSTSFPFHHQPRGSVMKKLSTKQLKSVKGGKLFRRY